MVFMGMGEPLLNLNNVVESVRLMTEYGRIFPEKITVSTVGIIKGIYALMEKETRVKVAVSLHSAIQEKREKLIPVARQNPLPELKKAILDYKKRTLQKVSLEYVLMKGVNDGDDDIKELMIFAREINCPVNLIEYNPVPQRPDLSFSGERRVNEVMAFLKMHNVYSSFRRARGQDIMAACGQLALFSSL